MSAAHPRVIVEEYDPEWAVRFGKLRDRIWPMVREVAVAIEHVGSGRSVMVAAPTSSGKTVVAEYALWRAMRDGSRAIYTTPIKALSNQKYRDLRDLYGDDAVGLVTGDIVERSRAPIVIMTTEVYRNMLLE